MYIIEQLNIINLHFKRLFYKDAEKEEGGEYMHACTPSLWCLYSYYNACICFAA